MMESFDRLHCLVMYSLILKAADEPLNLDNTPLDVPAATTTSQELFPYDERLEESLGTLLALVNQDGRPETRAAFGEFLSYVERLEKTLKQQWQHQPRRLTWIETGTLTLN